MNKKTGTKIAITIFLFILLAGCYRIKHAPFVEGIYVFNPNSQHPDIAQVKVELTLIDEETYIRANGINVIEDYEGRSGKKNYAFKLYFFMKSLDKYIQIDAYDFYHQVGGAPQIYFCNVVEPNEQTDVTGITICYDAKRIVLYSGSLYSGGKSYLYGMDY